MDKNSTKYIVKYLQTIAPSKVQQISSSMLFKNQASAFSLLVGK